MAAQPCWAVRGTKKGDLPVAAEKRGQHSVVVIRNVERPALLASEIQKALGAGGSVSAAGDVEVLVAGPRPAHGDDARHAR